MKRNYFVSTHQQANGDHEVHEATCGWLPSIDNRKHLGEFNNCAEAVSSARKLYPKADGCKFCSRECHTR